MRNKVYEWDRVKLPEHLTPFHHILEPAFNPTQDFPINTGFMEVKSTLVSQVLRSAVKERSAIQNGLKNYFDTHFAGCLEYVSRYPHGTEVYAKFERHPGAKWSKDKDRPGFYRPSYTKTGRKLQEELSRMAREEYDAGCYIPSYAAHTLFPNLFPSHLIQSGDYGHDHATAYIGERNPGKRPFKLRVTPLLGLNSVLVEFDYIEVNPQALMIWKKEEEAFGLQGFAAAEAEYIYGTLSHFASWVVGQGDSELYSLAAYQAREKLEENAKVLARRQKDRDRKRTQRQMDHLNNRNKEK